MKNLNIYIHIPFCNKKCDYCHFYSVEKMNLDYYLLALQKEIIFKFKKYNLSNYKIKTIYFGGGTPSLLSKYHIDFIFNVLSSFWDLSNLEEVNLELHPSYILEEYLDDLKNTAINRLSFGIQSFQEKFSKYINRKHNLDHIKNLLIKAKHLGFKVNLDFIYALPEQTLSDLKKDLEILDRFLSKQYFQHLSFYELEIFENTNIFKLKQKFPNLFPKEKTIIKMNEIIHQFWQERGGEHYEISNYAFNKNYSQHNLNFWTMEDYISFGPSAESRLSNLIIKNKNDIHKYYEMKDFFEEITLRKDENVLQYFMLALRLNKSINLKNIEPELAKLIYIKNLELPKELFKINNEEEFILSNSAWLKYNALLNEYSDIIYDYYNTSKN